MQTEKYVRKPFYVDVALVTEDNLSEVAEWCAGTVEGDHVKVPVHRPLNERQTKAFAGDRVLKAGTGFKVYTAKAFANSFEKLEGVAADNAVQADKVQPA